MGRTYFEREFAVEVPRVYVNVKIPLKNFSIKEPLLLHILSLILNTNFGLTSIFRETLTDSKLVLTLGTWARVVKDYVILEVSARTKYPEEVIPILKEKLKSLEYLEEDINRKIKVLIANMVLGFEDIDEMKDILISMIEHYGKVIDNNKDLLESISKKDCLTVLNEISMKEMSVVVLKPFIKKKGES